MLLNSLLSPFIDNDTITIMPARGQLQIPKNTDDFRFAADDLVLLASLGCILFRSNACGDKHLPELSNLEHSICTASRALVGAFWWQHLAQADCCIYKGIHKVEPWASKAKQRNNNQTLKNSIKFKLENSHS